MCPSPPLRAAGSAGGAALAAQDGWEDDLDLVIQDGQPVSPAADAPAAGHAPGAREPPAGEAVGVARPLGPGIMLHHHPSVPINVPLTQARAPAVSKP